MSTILFQSGRLINTLLLMWINYNLNIESNHALIKVWDVIAYPPSNR